MSHRLRSLLSEEKVDYLINDAYKNNGIVSSNADSLVKSGKKRELLSQTLVK